MKTFLTPTPNIPIFCCIFPQKIHPSSIIPLHPSDPILSEGKCSTGMRRMSNINSCSMHLIIEDLGHVPVHCCATWSRWSSLYIGWATRDFQIWFQISITMIHCSTCLQEYDSIQLRIQMNHYLFPVHLKPQNGLYNGCLHVPADFWIRHTRKQRCRQSNYKDISQ